MGKIKKKDPKGLCMLFFLKKEIFSMILHVHAHLFAIGFKCVLFCLFVLFDALRPSQHSCSCPDGQFT